MVWTARRWACTWASPVAAWATTGAGAAMVKASGAAAKARARMRSMESPPCSDLPAIWGSGLECLVNPAVPCGSAAEGQAAAPVPSHLEVASCENVHPDQRLELEGVRQFD